MFVVTVLVVRRVVAKQAKLWRECAVSEEPVSPSSFLLAELRRARLAAGLSQEDLGKAINYSSSLVSAVENGQRPATAEYLASVDEALDTGGRLRRYLLSSELAPSWFRDWLTIEREATLLRWFEPLVVPGLLQTPAYCHAILTGAGLLDPEGVTQLVTGRMERRVVLDRNPAPKLIAILDEAVLRRPVGSSVVMAEQCGQLLAYAQRSNIRIHVVPSAVGAYAGLAGAFVLAQGHESDAAYLDNAWQAQSVGPGAARDSLFHRWESIRGEALPRALSLQVIREAVETWQT